MEKALDVILIGRSSEDQDGAQLGDRLADTAGRLIAAARRDRPDVLQRLSPSPAGAERDTAEAVLCFSGPGVGPGRWRLPPMQSAAARATAARATGEYDMNTRDIPSEARGDAQDAELLSRARGPLGRDVAAGQAALAEAAKA